ncbi:MAG TPA: hypothetical protein VIK18_11190 [Pirellulales bacterium]
MKARFVWCLLVASWIGPSLVSAQTPTKEVETYPMLMDVVPLAVQAGQTAEHQVRSRYTMEGAYRVLVSGSGLTAEVVPPEEPAAAPPAKAAKPAAGGKPAAKAKRAIAELKLRFHAAADALPGVRDFRIATPQGASTLGQIVVTRDPVVVETEPNDTAATATAVKTPATICGAVGKAEDVDFYKFHAAQGSSLSFHVRSARCQDRIHDLQQHIDPIVTLRNAAGTVLAMSDNYFFADALLHYRFAAAGDYYLEIRDVRYMGNTYWQYAIEVNDRPLVTTVFPVALAREKSTRLELVGFDLPADPSVTLTLPGSTPLGNQWIDLPLKARANPAAVWVSDLPLTVAAADNLQPAKAQTIELPAGVNGRVRRPGEVHYYRFQAAKGERFTFDAIGRQLQSAMDPIIAVLNEKGARAVENDDYAEGQVFTGDARIEHWAAPAAGRYLLEVRDLHLGGGPEYVYFLQARRSEPYFSLQLDTDKTIVSAGGAAMLFVRVFRHNGFAGEVKLHVEGLPPAVKATCGRILDGVADGCIVLQADRAALPSLANVRVVGQADFAADGKNWKLKAVARPLQETYLPGGGRGLFPVDWHTVAIARPMDILAVELSQTQITLKPGESKKIDVKIRRAAGFDKNVTLDVMYRHLGGISGNSLPPGVTLDDKKSRTLLTAKLSAGAIVLTAAADAKPVDKQVVPVIASVSVNFVMKFNYAGPPLLVTVEKK